VRSCNNNNKKSRPKISKILKIDPLKSFHLENICYLHEYLSLCFIYTVGRQGFSFFFLKCPAKGQFLRGNIKEVISFSVSKMRMKHCSKELKGCRQDLITQSVCVNYNILLLLYKMIRGGWGVVGDKEFSM
jgi:hypothetical protein